MFESKEIFDNKRAVIVSILAPTFKGHETLLQTQESIEELRELLRTLEVATLDAIYQTKDKVEAGTVLGTGKLEEIAEHARSLDCKLLVFDFELSAGQLRNIKKITKLEIIDRCNIILEIFAKHARTKEAQLQVEISKLEYFLPRLRSYWTHFTKKRGGIGLMSGEGEQQLELDKRLIRNRILHLKKQLDEVIIARKVRQERRNRNVLVAALVGYTNVGKSTLLNQLCRVQVLAEDKLFATLDATCRTLNPQSKPPMVMVDTVGLISQLPTSLVQGFKSTLDSAEEADLLIIVCDISSRNVEQQLETTFKFLTDLKIDHKPQLIIFNKKDKLADFSADELLRIKILHHSYPKSITISSMDSADIKMLRQKIIDTFLENQKEYDLFIPYHSAKHHAEVMQKTNIISTEHHHDGIYYRIKIPSVIFDSLGLHQFILDGSLQLRSR